MSEQGAPQHANWCESIARECNCGADDELPESQPREEGVCDDCHRKYPTPWFAANPLWNRVIPDRQGMLCPNCFIWRAQKAGVGTTGWEVREEQLEPESQPSPSGDYEKEAKKLLRSEAWLSLRVGSVGELKYFADWLRSHDAKVSGQAERLRATLNDVLAIAQNAPELNMANYDEEQVSALNQAMTEVFQLAEAALQESPSE